MYICDCANLVACCYCVFTCERTLRSSHSHFQQRHWVSERRLKRSYASSHLCILLLYIYIYIFICDCANLVACCYCVFTCERTLRSSHSHFQQRHWVSERRLKRSYASSHLCILLLWCVYVWMCVLGTLKSKVRCENFHLLICKRNFADSTTINSWTFSKEDVVGKQKYCAVITQQEEEE